MSDSPRLHTPRRLTQRSRITREIDSAQYETQGRLTHGSITHQGDFYKKMFINSRNLNQIQKYFNLLFSGPGSNEEKRKKLEVKNLVGISL